MKRQILISLILVGSVFTMNAQIYTPSGTIQGSSGNNNVGVGVNNPQSLLEIYDNSASIAQVNMLTIRSNAQSASYDRGATSFIDFKGAANFTGAKIGFHHNQGYGHGADLSFWTEDYSGNLNQRLIVNYNGSIGIGVSNPTQRLEISGNIKLINYAYQEFNIGNTKGYIWGNHDYNGSSGLFQDDLVFSANWQGVNSNTDNITNESAFLRNAAISLGRHGIRFFTSTNSTSAPTAKVTITSDGMFGIGTSSPAYILDVIGTIRAREIKVDLNGADFVFEKDYKLMPLNELEKFVKEQKHLPEIAPAKEMEKNGTELGDLNSKLLQKIEEMTLYIIEQNKTNEQQNKMIEELKQLVKLQSEEIKKLKPASK